MTGASPFEPGGNAGSLDISATEEWAALRQHAAELRSSHLRDLFDADPGRADRFTTTVGDLAVDWSRQIVTDRTIELLLALAERAGVVERIAATLAGEPVNATEGRAALHTALRAGPGARRQAPATAPSPRAPREPTQHETTRAAVTASGSSDEATSRGTTSSEAASAAVAELRRMAAFARAVRSGERRGATGRPVRTVVNLGIGGSHLGAAMACEALAAFCADGPECRFVANIDPADLADALAGLDPAETLFVVVSKSFTTAETLANATAARAWAETTLGAGAADRHFAAVTAEPGRAADFGVAAEDTFAVWDWVGGRYSLASAAGLALMVAAGEDSFAEMLDGMRRVDEHLASAPAAANVPLLTGLLAVWNRNFLGLPARAALPYSHRLRLLPAHLQQLHMESNGKRVRLDGSPVSFDTAPIVWGAAGTDGQHSFHQFLHQGTTVVPADFIVFARPDPDTLAMPDAERRHEALVANCLAQAAALAFGTPSVPVDDPLGPHRELPGNRPSTLIMAPQLTPSVLGQLVALYEHEVAVQGAVWGINSFDQFGVEHGKALADAIVSGLDSATAGSAVVHDPATKASIGRHQQMKHRLP